MKPRKIPFYNEGVFHITSKSIENYKIFRNSSDFFRFKELLKYYNHSNVPISYSRFLEYKLKNFKVTFENEIFNSQPIVSILTYCLMDTHIHIILRQKKDKGITNFCTKVFQSFSLYFNHKYKRKGPLWSGKFNDTHIESEEQLFHDIAYIHLNPVTAYMVEDPGDWKYSSHHEYLNKKNNGICDIIEIPDYKSFVLERIEYFRERARLKNLE
ncbi:MAG: hypothetical protein PHQ52_04450 [Candidatus Omnitrophica bacterium]|nr:hypothetical protein [Candidatus Omnitrophota bacterium]